ncbi:MAG: DUF1801 domain-containing protein [Chloroflexota bacterium]|nr:DUF1801 domain-containing protein [Chloroflexota bacterium]
MNEQVTDYIDKLAEKAGQEWQVEVCKRLRVVVFAAIPDTDERLQYGKPHYRKNNQYAAVIGTAKGWVTLTIFNAQGIQPPEGMFESSDTGDRKTIKIVKGQTVDEDLLKTLLAEAAAGL